MKRLVLVEAAGRGFVRGEDERRFLVVVFCMSPDPMNLLPPLARVFYAVDQIFRFAAENNHQLNDEDLRELLEMSEGMCLPEESRCAVGEFSGHDAEVILSLMSCGAEDEEVEIDIPDEPEED